MAGVVNGRRPLFALLGACVSALAGGGPLTAQSAGLEGVEASRASFNPGAGQEVALSYRLAGPERVTVQVYDPDGGLVRTLVDAQQRDAGAHSEPWDGRDADGVVVPDEAYFFVIETASGKLYDPTTFSGGEVGDVLEVEHDRESGTIGYRLPRAARVLCRLGIRNGPMLRTLVDWKPRVAGAITEHWQGWDEDRVVRFYDHPDFSGIITWVALPDTSVIAFGNRDETYREMKLGRGQSRLRKPDRPRVAGDSATLRPAGLVPPAWSRSPRVSLELPDIAADGAEIPEVGERVRVRVDVDLTDRARLQGDQFEIIFFVDNVFLAEAERGYTPLNWTWETHQLPPGEYVLTVNLASFRGQVGAASRKVRVRARE